MDLNNFYIFGSTFSQVPVCVVNKGLDWETNCRIVKGDFTGVEFPIVFNQFSGKKWTDVLSPNSISMYIINQRFIGLLEKDDITGWTSYPIVIFDSEGQEVSGYVGLSIIGVGGVADYSKSETFEKKLIPNGPKSKYYKGLHVGFDKWDGSDFFIPAGTLHIIITEKVKQIIKKFKITNTILQSLAEYEVPEYALPKNTSLS